MKTYTYHKITEKSGHSAEYVCGFTDAIKDVTKSLRKTVGKQDANERIMILLDDMENMIKKLD